MLLTTTKRKNNKVEKEVANCPKIVVVYVINVLILLCALVTCERKGTTVTYFT